MGYSEEMQKVVLKHEIWNKQLLDAWRSKDLATDIYNTLTETREHEHERKKEEIKKKYHVE